jgi:hypothetical protein
VLGEDTNIKICIYKDSFHLACLGDVRLLWLEAKSTDLHENTLVVFSGFEKLKPVTQIKALSFSLNDGLVLQLQAAVHE